MATAAWREWRGVHIARGLGRSAVTRPVGTLLTPPAGGKAACGPPEPRALGPAPLWAPTVSDFRVPLPAPCGGLPAGRPRARAGARGKERHPQTPGNTPE